jgi:hypothetical protein
MTFSCWIRSQPLGRGLEVTQAVPLAIASSAIAAPTVSVSTVLASPAVHVGTLFTHAVGSDSYGCKVLDVKRKGKSIQINSTRVDAKGKTASERAADLGLPQVHNVMIAFFWRPISGRWIQLDAAGKERPTRRGTGERLLFGTATTELDRSF